MRAITKFVLFILCVSTPVFSQAPAKKGKEAAKEAAAPRTFHDFLPANAGLVVAASSRQRLVQLVTSVLAEMKKQTPSHVPSETPEQIVDQAFAQVTSAGSPLEGVAGNQPLGFALGLDFQRYYFLPAADADALKKGLVEGTYVEKGKYVVLTPMTGYVEGKSPLRAVGKGDIVVSIRPNVWLKQFKPFLDNMLQGIVAQLGQQPGQENAGKILQAEISVLSTLLDGTSQLDLALSLDKNDINATLYTVPAKEGVVHNLFQILQKAEIPETESLAKLVDDNAMVQIEAYIPPDALKLLLDLVPWSQLVPEGEGKGNDVVKEAFTKYMAVMDGRQAQSFSITGPPLSFTGSAVVGVKSADEYRGILREFFEGEGEKSLVASMSAIVPGLEFKFQKNSFQVEKIPVDTFTEKFALPQQPPVEIAVQTLAVGNTAIAVFGKDPKDPKAIEAILTRFRSSGSKATKPAASTADAPRRFLKGKEDLGEFIKLGFKQFAGQAGQPLPSDADLSELKLSTRFEVYVGKSSIMAASHTALPEVFKFISVMEKIVPHPPSAQEPPPEPPAESDKDQDADKDNK